MDVCLQSKITRLNESTTKKRKERTIKKNIQRKSSNQVKSVQTLDIYCIFMQLVMVSWLFACWWCCFFRVGINISLMLSTLELTRAYEKKKTFTFIKWPIAKWYAHELFSCTVKWQVKQKNDAHSFWWCFFVCTLWVEFSCGETYTHTSFFFFYGHSSI